MNLKLFGIGAILIVCFGIFLTTLPSHPKEFGATNISPERVDELYKSNPPDTVKELFEIVKALHHYSKDNLSYPKSDFIFMIDSIKKDDWIKGLVPKYLPRLPNRPTPHVPNEATFIYKSNGGYFMILARHPEDCQWVKQNFSELLYSTEDQCTGFGVWTRHRHQIDSHNVEW